MEFAKKVNLTKRSLQRIEYGESKLNVDDMIRICQTFDLPQTYFLDDKTNLLAFSEPDIDATLKITEIATSMWKAYEGNDYQLFPIAENTISKSKLNKLASERLGGGQNTIYKKDRIHVLFHPIYYEQLFNRDYDCAIEVFPVRDMDDLKHWVLCLNFKANQNILDPKTLSIFFDITEIFSTGIDVELLQQKFQEYTGQKVLFFGYDEN